MTSWNPPEEHPFDRAREPAGRAVRHISLSGLTIRLDGLDDEADAFVVRRFRRYLEDRAAADPVLHLGFARDDGAPFIQPDGRAGVIPEYLMRHAVRGGRLFHASASVCACLDLASGRGRALVRPREGVIRRQDPVHLAIENLLRSCMAWTVLLRGGFMLHAASVVRDGRCYLFFGNSGSGKSTLAALSGGQVISDDLTMVLPAKDGFAAIGSPFRQTHTACDDLTGRYPVVALYRLVKDTQVALERREPAAMFPQFLANLPFVVGEIGNHPDAWALARGAFARVRCYALHFRKDPSFWDAVIDEEARISRR